jgi:drug/metabolite transporter (DMT)-like permease
MIVLSQQTKGALLVLLSAAGFSTLAIFIKFAYGAGANTLTILTMRFSLASLCLWALLKIFEISPRITIKTAIKLCLMGALGYGSMSFLFAASLQYLPASLTEMLLFTYPTLVSVLSFIIGDEKFSWQKGVALFICLVGLFFILGVSFTGISHFGILLGLSCAVIYSCYILIGNRVLKNVHSLVATTYVSSAAALAFAAYSLSTNQLILTLPTEGWLALLGTASFGTILGILGFFAGISKIGAASASIISTAEPVLTVILSVLVLGEELSFLQFFGGLLIIASILLLQLCTNTTEMINDADSTSSLNVASK